MPIVVTCPSCSTTLKAPDSAAGKRVKCPKCTSPIDVPAAAPPPVVEEEFTDEPLPPARGEAAPRREEQAYAGAVPPPDWQSNRQAIALAAVIPNVGPLGIHKFMMGKTSAGLIMLLVSLFGCGVGFFVMWVIGVMEGIKYMKMSDAEFYETYVVGDKAWL